MGFEDPNKNLTAGEILANFDSWKEEKLKHLKFLLVKDYGLESSAEIEIELAPGKKIRKMTIRDRGTISNFELDENGIRISTQDTLNDSNVSVIEEGIFETNKLAVRDYLIDNPKDLPLVD